MSSNSGSTTTPAVPDWLNMAFVERRLQNHYKKEQIKVINFVIKSASGDLGNFGSKIYRANVTFSIPSSDQCAVTSEVGRPSNFYVNLQKKRYQFLQIAGIHCEFDCERSSFRRIITDCVFRT